MLLAHHITTSFNWTNLIFSDAKVEGEWIHHLTGEKVDLSFGAAKGAPTTSTANNCGMLIPMWNGWKDFPCISNNVITCACEHPKLIYLQMRGLCKDSNIDRFYVPRNKKMSGAVELIGLMTSTISYDKVSWILTENFKVVDLSIRTKSMNKIHNLIYLFRTQVQCVMVPWSHMV